MSDAPADGSVAAPPDTSSSRRQFFALVVALFCLAILFHKARLGSRDVLSHHMLVCLVALWTLLRPVSVGRFTTLMGVYLWSTLLDLPSVVNHIMFFALTAVPLAALIIAEALRARRMPAPETVFDHLGPYLRIQVVLMYAFAAFAKLNSGFFDTELSCGVVMYKALHFRNLLPQGSWTALPAIWGTVVVEVLLPVLLSLRATRIAGVFLAIGFHTTMALAGHIPFSGFSLPLLAVFLPEDLPDRFARVRLDQPLVERWSTRISALARSPMAFPGLAIAWVLLIPIPTYEFLPWFVRESVFDEGLLMVFLFLMAVVTLLLVLALRLAPRPRSVGRFRITHPVLALGPALLVLNAVQPYVGLKTHHSFTMYSNLQTEAGQWNHLVVPRAVHVFSFQDDLVRILESDDPKLAASAARGARWVFFQFQARVRGRPDATVTFERGGKVVTIRPGDDRSALGDPPNPFLAKLFSFRNVDPPDQSTCRW